MFRLRELLKELVLVIWLITQTLRGFEARPLVGARELEAAKKLRYQIFCLELGWVSCSGEQETDRYDENAVHFGVFIKGVLVGVARIISGRPFMLEKEESFAGLASQPFREKSAEISRLGLKKEIRKSDGRKALLFLYRVMGRWLIENDYHYFYMVTSRAFLRGLQELFACQLIGRANHCVVAVVDIKEAWDSFRRRHPILFWWFFYRFGKPL